MNKQTFEKRVFKEAESAPRAGWNDSAAINRGKRMVTDREVRVQPEFAEMLFTQLENLLEACARLRSDVLMAMRLARMTNGGSAEARAHRTRAREAPRASQTNGVVIDPEDTEDEPEDLSDGLGAIAPLPTRGLTIEDVDDERIYTVKDAAEILGLRDHAVRKLAREGKEEGGLVGIKHGRGGRGGGYFVFSGSELKRYHATLNNRN